MVHDYDHWMFHPCEVVVSFLQGLDDSEELSVIDVIISFCREEGSGMVSTRV